RASGRRLTNGDLPMSCRQKLLGAVLLFALAGWLGFQSLLAQSKKDERFLDPINVNPPPIATDTTVKYDYDIVYVKAPRKGDKGRTLWADIAHPAIMEANADLMLLHPDGSEEPLVKGGDNGAIAD